MANDSKKSTSSAITVTDVVKKYDGGTILDKVSFKVSQGSITVLVGSNGAGKSTLIKAICGLVKPDSGNILLFGAKAGSREARIVTSVAFDEPSLYADLTVFEHLTFSARLSGIEDSEERLNELLEKFEISYLSERLPRGFSRGQRQKVALSMALARSFKILLLDEPYVGLDSAGKTALVELLKEARAQKVAVLIATHSPELVAIADQMITLTNGKVTYTGEPKIDRIER
ncbi:MAG: ABC transporter ATP-binding protein [Actinomycetota bacterium]|nr:ABC transporter ATP-binding protein [Actinomycetota bacterium]